MFINAIGYRRRFFDNTIQSIKVHPWFWGLLTLSLFLRLYHFFDYPDDAHEFRQVQTLIYAASYGKGAGWLTPYENWFGATPKIAVLEFPIQEILVYLLSKLTNNLLIAARIISFLSGIGAIYFFYKICRYRNHPHAFFAVLLFAFTPVVLFYSHSVQLEGLLLLFVLIAAFCALKAIEGSRFYFCLTVLLFVIFSTQKPSALVILALPIIYLGFKNHKLLIMGCIVASGGIADFVWGLFVKQTLLTTTPDWYYTASNFKWVFGPLALRWSSGFYLSILGNLFFLLLPPLTFILVIIAIRKRVADPFWLWWFVGGVASILIFANLNAIHFYYQLPMTPALAALAAFIIPDWNKFSRILSLTLVIVLSTLSFLYLFHENPISLHAGQALARIHTSNHPPVVLSDQGLSPGVPTFLYYADLNGWNLPRTANSQMIDKLSGLHPCELVMVFDEGDATDPGLPSGWHAVERTKEYVTARRVIPAEDDCPSK